MNSEDWTPERAQAAARAQGLCGELLRGGREICILHPGHQGHDFICDACGHVAGEHSYQHGCGHSVTLREDATSREYVCACIKQPGEVTGLGAAVNR
jgi:hypothetical protein